MSNEAFYYWQDDAAHGPWTLPEMMDKSLIGVMKQDALVCQAGEAQWSTIHQHPRLWMLRLDYLNALEDEKKFFSPPTICAR
jgi:hypothetical protein